MADSMALSRFPADMAAFEARFDAASAAVNAEWVSLCETKFGVDSEIKGLTANGLRALEELRERFTKEKMAEWPQDLREKFPERREQVRWYLQAATDFSKGLPTPLARVGDVRACSCRCDMLM